MLLKFSILALVYHIGPNFANIRVSSSHASFNTRAHTNQSPPDKKTQEQLHLADTSSPLPENFLQEKTKKIKSPQVILRQPQENEDSNNKLSSRSSSDSPPLPTSIKYNMNNVMKESKLKVPVPPNNENYPSKETSKVNLTTQTTKIEDKQQQQQTKNFKLRAPKQEEKPKKTYKKKTTKKQNDIQTNNIKKYFSTTTETNKQQVETVQNENVTRTHVPNIEKENIRSMAAVIRSPITDDGVKSNLQISDQKSKETTFTSKQQLDSDYCGPNDLKI